MLGERITISIPPDEPAEPARREYPAQHRARGRRADRDRQAEGAGGASGGRKPHRHAGQRADRPLRRKPFGDRRRQAPRHRAPARQGHDRRDGGGEDRPGAPRAVAAIRRPRPHRPAGARLSRLRLGRAGPAAGARSTRRSTATPRRATSRPSAQGGREAITHWEVLEKYAGARRQAGREPALLPAGDRADPPDPGASRPYRPSAARRRHLRARLQDQGRPAAAESPPSRSRLLADRPCMPISWASSTPKQARKSVSKAACRTI